MINHDKTALICSMNNLINHISSSQQSQHQIFESLEAKDFYKIISNLTDSNKELRITSALLLALLLHNSESLQRQFCLTMNIHFSNNSEIIINNNFDKLIQQFPHKAPQIFKIIKNYKNAGSTFSIKSKSLLWVINPQKSNLAIEELSKEYLQDLIKNNRFNDNPQEASFDPLFCIFGVSIVSSIESEYKQRSTENTQLSNSQDFSPKTIQQLQPPLVFPSAYTSNSQPLQRLSMPLQMRVTVSRFDYLNKTTNVNTAVKTQRYFNEVVSDEKPDQGLKKISLTQNKRKRIEQLSKVKFIYEGGPQTNQVIRSSGYSNNKNEQFISQSCHIPEAYKKVVEQTTCFTPLTIGYNGVGHQSLRNQQMMGSSMRVKNIAMNGRPGWESSNNTINMTNSNGYVNY